VALFRIEAIRSGTATEVRGMIKREMGQPSPFFVVAAFNANPDELFPFDRNLL
jgi:hypothetical protein